MSLEERVRVVEDEVKQAAAGLIVIEGRLDGIEATLKEHGAALKEQGQALRDQGDPLRQILAKVA